MTIDIDIIKLIKKAEEDGERIIENSVCKARGIILSAEKKRQLIIEETLERGEREAEEIFRNKENDAREEIRKMHKIAEEEVQFIKKEVEPKIEAAVDMVIERIVKIHGNS